jgi:adenosylhomocysteinase
MSPARKKAIVCGYRLRMNSCIEEILSRVVVTEVDPICVLQAWMKDWKCWKWNESWRNLTFMWLLLETLEIIMIHYMAQRKNNTIARKIDQFNSELDI